MQLLTVACMDTYRFNYMGQKYTHTTYSLTAYSGYFFTARFTLTTFRFSNESRFTCIASHVTYYSTVLLAKDYKLGVHI